MAIFVTKTREQRRRENERIRREKERKEKKELEEVEKEKLEFPFLISSLYRKLKRMDLKSSILKMNPWECAYVCYYGLHRLPFCDERKVVVSNRHAWVEFKFNDEWWIFDPLAIIDNELKEPLRRRKYTNIDIYNSLRSEFDDIKAFKSIYDNKISLTEDEAKIAAMEDRLLNSL